MLSIVVENDIQVHLPLPLVVNAYISPLESSFKVCMTTFKLLLGPEPTTMVGVPKGLLPGKELLHVDLGPVDLGGDGVDARERSTNDNIVKPESQSKLKLNMYYQALV